VGLFPLNIDHGADAAGIVLKSRVVESLAGGSRFMSIQFTWLRSCNGTSAPFSFCKKSMNALTLG